MVNNMAKTSVAVADYTADGRKPYKDLVNSFDELEKDGWIKEVIMISQRDRNGHTMALPILSYRTPETGPATWIISGIHGEEPAGPNAIAEGIDHIKALGKKGPVVLLPVCNPLGYASNWRYLNMPKWEKGVEGHSVGDMECVLPDLKDPNLPRAKSALSPESEALAKQVLKLAKDYPPLMTLDFHEDDLIHEGYIYSQGGAHDPVARRIVEMMSAKGVAIKKGGNTRFDEPIDKGIVGWTNDGSIDELLSSKNAVVDGKVVDGPNAKTAIVFETPAAAMPLEQRKNAYLDILAHVPELVKLQTLSRHGGLRTGTGPAM
jgi:hypothetical protein